MFGRKKKERVKSCTGPQRLVEPVVCRSVLTERLGEENTGLRDERESVDETRENYV